MNRVIHLFKKIVFILSIAVLFLHKFSRDERRIKRFFQCVNKKPIQERILLATRWAYDSMGIRNWSSNYKNNLFE